MEVGPNRSDFIPTVVILIISTFAFGIGSYQVQINQELTDKNNQATQYQYQYDVSDKYTKNIVQIDDQYIGYSLDAMEQAYQMSLVFLNHNSTYTTQQRNTALIEMGLRINTSIDWIFQSNANAYFYYFQTNPTENYYYLLTKSQAGFDLAINRTEFFNENPILLNSTADFLINYGLFNPGVVTELFSSPAFAPYPWYPIYYIRYLQYIFWDTIDVFLSHVNTLKNDIQYLGNLNNYLLLSVSISTLATVLSATISDRKDHRENEAEFASIRSAYYNNPNLELNMTDKFSIALLVIALLVSVIGVSLPFLLRR